MQHRKKHQPRKKKRRQKASTKQKEDSPVRCLWIIATIFAVLILLISISSQPGSLLEDVGNIVRFDTGIRYDSFESFPFEDLTINPLQNKHCKKPSHIDLRNISRSTNLGNNNNINAAFVVYKMCNSRLYPNSKSMDEQAQLLNDWLNSFNKYYPTIDKILMTPQTCCNQSHQLVNGMIEIHKNIANNTYTIHNNNNNNHNNININININNNQEQLKHDCFYNGFCDLKIRCMPKWTNDIIPSMTKDKNKNININRNWMNDDDNNVVQPNPNRIQRNMPRRYPTMGDKHGDKMSNMIKNEYGILDDMRFVINKNVVYAARDNLNCCNGQEFGKLDGWKLIEYDYIFMLDWDIKLLKPIDELFYCMESKKYDFFNTKGSMSPFNGGFLVLRPNIEIYKEMRYLLKYGIFTNDDNWFASNIDFFHGAETNQGFLFWYFYYYDEKDKRYYSKNKYHLKKHKVIEKIYNYLNITRNNSALKVNAKYIDQCVYNCQGWKMTNTYWSQTPCQNSSRQVKVDHQCHLYRYKLQQL